MSVTSNNNNNNNNNNKIKILLLCQMPNLYTWSQVIVLAGNEVLTRGSQRPLFSPCS